MRHLHRVILREAFSQYKLTQPSNRSFILDNLKKHVAVACNKRVFTIECELYTSKIIKINKSISKIIINKYACEK
jgi:hypothetical protein